MPRTRSINAVEQVEAPSRPVRLSSPPLPAAVRPLRIGDAPAVTRLKGRRISKVWGRRDLPSMFGQVDDREEPVGEIWFEDPLRPDVPLLVKYLFTSEKLSVQVHPDDAIAKRAGQKSGKDEAWVVLASEPDSEIGIGLKKTLSDAELRSAALDGSIEELVDWRPAAAGDTYYSPAGTIHAIGPGLMLVEIQQNVDLTYRLYDYGRPRDLHLDEAVPAADPRPYQPPVTPYRLSDAREILVHGQAFVLERWTGARTGILPVSAEEPVWMVPLKGSGMIGNQPVAPGSVLLVEGQAALELGTDADVLIAYCGTDVRQALVL